MYMNQKEFEILKTYRGVPHIISVDDLINKTDRTLLYGYTCNRDTWHVYLKDGQIVTLVYGWSYENESSEFKYHVKGQMNEKSCVYSYNIIEIENNIDFIPDKRIYPNACDFEFCKLILDAGGHLPFTGDANDTSEKKQYYALVI